MFNEFVIEYNKDNSNITICSKKVKIKNQTLLVEFINWDGLKNNTNQWYMSAIIYSKRKHKHKLFEDCTSSGKIGVLGLYTAKNILLEFEDFLKDKFSCNFNYILIYGADSKRKRIYNEALKKFGYEIKTIYNYPVLIKKIN